MIIVVKANIEGTPRRHGMHQDLEIIPLCMEEKGLRSFMTWRKGEENKH